MSGPSTAHFPIVALGGSAGGLTAFTTFLEAVEAAKTPIGMAFIIVPHLSPDAKSHMGELLQRETRLPVTEIDGPTTIEPDHVYILRPDTTLGITDGHLTPRKRSPGPKHHPVDDVFKALAETFGARTVGIVLSGTGSNGSASIPAIREAGGLVLAQTPDSAEFDEMPRRATDTGLVDAVLSPADMIGALFRHRDYLRANPGADSRDVETGEKEQSPASGNQDAFADILKILQKSAGFDFRQYKRGTLQRRIDRRLHLARVESLSAYADMLRTDEGELQALADDLLITVTGFFRDEKAWKELREHAIRSVIKAHENGDPLRAWVAGCASGEEAYSLAIELFEEARAQGKAVPVEIFATDASSAALARARVGVYPAAAVQNLSQTYQDRYFEREDDSVRVRQDLRETVVFAPQNLIQDPPFSHLDFVICRNVLIYLQTDLQQKLIRLFHFALKEGGHLFLGSAESLGSADDLFSTSSKQWRLYRRQGATRHDIVDFPLVEGRSRRAIKFPDTPDQGARGPTRIAERTLKALADRHAPPSVLVDGDMTILYHQGETDRFLRRQSGQPTQNLAVLARDGPGPRLRRLVDEVKLKGDVATGEARLTGADGPAMLEIEAAPLDKSAANALILVSFRETAAIAPRDDDDTAPSSREEELEAEVALLRDEIASTSASGSRTQEELKSYNEEVMSMNEELRAANEELETSKEELQSLNEELNTVNSQLRVKVEELYERTNDLSNLLTSTDIATLFLTADLHIRWFSPRVSNLFNIRSSDTDRPISDLVRNFDDPDFAEDCRSVLKTLKPHDREVKTEDGQWFVRVIVPYRTDQDRIDGVVVTFSNVTAIQAARRYAEKIVETVPNPFLVLDEKLRVVSANAAFYETFQVVPDQTLCRLVYDLGNGQWNIPELRKLLTDVLPDDEKFSGYEMRHTFDDVGDKIMRLSGQRVDHMQLVLLAIEDITEQRRAEMHQQTLMEELNHRVKNALSVVQALASQTLKRAEALDDFSEVFQGRLAALAKGHSQLLSRDWDGADIVEVVESTVMAFDPERISVSGPRQILAPKKSLALNLILHELETNAVKYGALSGTKGRIHIEWTSDDGRTTLAWQESGGPPVTKPEKEGFGSQLTRQIVEYELHGEIDLRFEPEGLRCEITFKTP